MSVFGTWNLTINTPMGNQEVVLVLSEQDGSPGGTATNGPATGDLHDLIVDGDHVLAAHDIATPFPMVVSFDLKVNGDAMSGTAVSGPFPVAPVTGVRA